MAEPEGSLVPERILELSERLSAVAGAKIGEISSINREAKMLAINALITAARAGEAGKAFAIVAEEFKRIASEIDDVAMGMETQVRADLRELSAVGGAILGHLRGQRLADLALNAIEIIDRNLYERTCDVRWWATDSAVVSCVAEPSDQASRFASSRLKVILDAYTVYLDLWICDARGKVVATGRPDRYPGAKDISVANAAWFQQSMRTASGDEFVACDIERAAPLGNAPVATYATAIREGGQTHGKVIGVLGIHFDWKPQAQAVVDGVRMTEEEAGRSRVMLLDHKGRVLASSDKRGELEEVFRLPPAAVAMGSYPLEGATVGYALTPGYETYQGLGWYGCILQREPPKSSAAQSTRAA
ncbi:methyl-accepting chemotaxis protein [Phenylobacterium aquaticum]|uniref:methyl-accepting chemotaxis protein n=1 Tax=Phenylobacterium aquaticum TaxID=1763816 RepID=UPI0026EB3DD7|nr:methyl-accepting chemotaxis protein [Phenylobacterium aquaticum]